MMQDQEQNAESIQSADTREKPDHTKPLIASKSVARPSPGPKHQWRHIPGTIKKQAKGWWKELGACFISLVVLGSLIAVVAGRDKEPSKLWGLGITINTVVSMHVTVLKALTGAVLASGLGQLKWIWYKSPQKLSDFNKFDQAAGLKNSIDLVCVLRHRYIWATLGALAVVALHVFEPFPQQLIEPYPCDWPVASEMATAIRSSYYPDTMEQFDHGTTSPPLPLELKAAINRGLFGGPGDLQITQDCRYGDCDFNQFSTLGYCSLCTDISDQIIPLNVSQSNYTYMLPFGYIDGCAPYEPTYMRIAGDGNNFTVLGGFLRGNPDSTSGEFEANPHMSCVAYTNGTWPCLGQGAANCTLFPCAKTLNNTMRDGILQEEVVDNIALPLIANTYGTVAPRQCLIDNDNDQALLVGTESDSNPEWLMFQGSHNNANLVGSIETALDDAVHDPNITIAQPCVYTMAQAISSQLISYFKQYLNGTQTSNPQAELPVVLQTVLPVYSQGSSQVIEQLFQGGNISFGTVDDAFAGIANSLTNQLRQSNESGYSVPAVGTNYRPITCIRVRWAWIAYPCALVLIIVAFLFGVIINTVLAGQEVWKKSSYPTLFHGLDNRAMDNMGDVETVEDMQQRAKEIRVHLTPRDGGLKLVEAIS